MRAAASRTFCTAGSSRPMRMAMMAMTTSSSISVKPRLRNRKNMAMERPPEKERRTTFKEGVSDQANPLFGEGSACSLVYLDGPVRVAGGERLAGPVRPADLNRLHL